MSYEGFDLSPLYTLHIEIVLSDYPDAKYSPFGEKAKLLTKFECPIHLMRKNIV